MKKNFLLLVCALSMVTQLSFAQTIIFDYRSAWKYLDNGSNQGTAWTTTAFSDATWASDTGWFGYGDPSFVTKLINGCGTVVASPSCTNKYITTYFRKVVNIANIAYYDSMTMNIIRDDAVAVYINGVEVWRCPNMPTGTLTYTTQALTAIGGASEYTPVSKTIPISYFVNGNNTIAVELHQESGTSSDVNFNMQMVGVPSPLFFDYRSAWKYLDNGTNQGTAWTGTGFSDATWASDTGWFGYGDPTFVTKLINGCGTVVANPTCTNKYITTYFRKVISIPSTAAYDSVKLSIIRDDAVAVYVNGTEVWRCPNMPTGTLSYTTQALSAIGNAAETTAVVKTIPISTFINGNNTIAVELHQESGTSSDVNFNMRMEGVRRITTPVATAVTLSYGPYLQMGSQTAANVRWRTNVASKSRAMFGTVAGTYPIVVNDASLVTDHEVRVTGLLPNTKYYYRFGTDTSILQGDTANFFTTAPADTSTRRVTVAVFGDCGQNNASYQSTTLTAYRNFLATNGLKAADLMLLGGDNAYNNGTDAEFTTKFFAPYSGNILKNHMLFPAPGNHDYDNGGRFDIGVPYYSIFSMPSAGESGGVPSGTEAYYSFDWGNIHFLSLDSYGKGDGNTTRMYDTAGAQVTWIKADLAANTKKWVIAYWHHPPYTMTSHNSDGESELVNIRQNFIRILERYGVDMIICGHSHAYERSYLMKGHYGAEATFNKVAHATDSSTGKYNGSTNSCPYTYPSGKNAHGTIYVVAGSSGASGGAQAGFPHNALPFAVNDGGMFFLDINDNRLDAKFVRRDNTIFDQFTIVKDTKLKDTIDAWPGTSISLNASWPGAYAWNNGATNRNTTIVVPNTDTLITVKDSLVRTCLTDQHFINSLCTNPAFTVTPSNVLVGACNAALAYSVADTATPTPTLTYAFSGATAGSGVGSGSGATFNTGVTNVTLTATNSCGSTNYLFTVTVTPVPAAVTVTGSGAYCDNTVITAANGGSGTIYYQGATSGGTSLTAVSSTQLVTSSGTHYFRARSSDGCWGPEGSATVTINPSPAAVSVTGGGVHCGNASITAGNGDSGIIYYQGNISSGTSLAVPSSLESVTSSGIYYFRARSAAGCWGVEGNVSVSVNPMPSAFAVTGGGSYCAAGPGSDISLSGSETAINYQLYNGLTPVGAMLTGTGFPLDFGLQAAPGNYTVVASNPVSSCNIPMLGAPSISINPLPAIYAVTGGGNYCSGDAGTRLGLSGSQAGVMYQLYNGGAAIGTPVAATGTVIDFGLHTLAGSYTVVAENATTHCRNNMTGSAAITINPLPVAYSVAGGGSYCAGGSGLHVGISASNVGTNYQLYNGSTPIGGIVGGVGSAIDFGLQTSPGSYFVHAVNASTGCTNNMTGSASVIVNTLPESYSLTGGGNFCAGGAGVHVGLSSSEPGVNYTLYNSSSPVFVMSGTGRSIDFGLQTSGGTYTVEATNSVTGCLSVMTGTAVVNIDPLPLLHTVTGGGDYCADSPGVHIRLSGSQVATKYYLYKGTTLSGAAIDGTGSNLDFGLRTATGTYTVFTQATVTGCERWMMGSAAVATIPLIFPSVGITADKASIVCKGDLVTYTAEPVNGGAAPVYQWMLNGVPAGVASNIYRVVPSDGDVIAVNMTSNAHCVAGTRPGTSVAMKVDSVIYPSVSITADPASTVRAGQRVTFIASLHQGGSSSSYQWVINKYPVPGATSFSYVSTTLSDGDSVSCLVTTTNACGEYLLSKSLIMHLEDVGVDAIDFQAMDVRVVPNPNKGVFQLEGNITREENTILIEITDMIGKVVYNTDLSVLKGKISHRVEAKGVAPGAYLLKIHSGQYNKVIHITIQ